MLDWLWLIFGLGALYAGPVYAAWTTFDNKWYAATAAVGWTTTWLIAILWIAVATTGS